jgi:hypothetical protein
MMLSVSIQANNEDANLHGVLDTSIDTGIPHGELLRSFAEALVLRGPELPDLRERIRSELGDEALTDASGTAGNFQRQVRIADAIGIPLDDAMLQRTAELREELGLDRFHHEG